MTLPRISPNQAAEVERLRTAGRPPRQIERMLGLTYGLLSKPYQVAEDSRPIMNRDHLHGRGWIQ